MNYPTFSLNCIYLHVMLMVYDKTNFLLRTIKYYLNNSTVLLLLLFSRCFRSTETIRLIRCGRRLRKRETIYLSLHSHHQNDSCIKVGSDESHFDVSLTVRDKVTRQCPQTTTSEEKGEPKRNRAEVLPLTSLKARS